MNRREMFRALGLATLAVAGRPASAQPQEGGRHKGHGKRTTARMVEEMRSMNETTAEHLGGSGAEFESRFIDLMIPHHEGAIAMARARKSTRAVRK